MADDFFPEMATSYSSLAEHASKLQAVPALTLASQGQQSDPVASTQTDAIDRMAISRFADDGCPNFPDGSEDE